MNSFYNSFVCFHDNTNLCWTEGSLFPFSPMTHESCTIENKQNGNKTHWSLISTWTMTKIGKKEEER